MCPPLLCARAIQQVTLPCILVMLCDADHIHVNRHPDDNMETFAAHKLETWGLRQIGGFKSNKQREFQNRWVNFSWI